jgi:hypothetical protein
MDIERWTPNVEELVEFNLKADRWQSTELANFMEQITTLRGANGRSASQMSPCPLWNPNIY